MLVVCQFSFHISTTSSKKKKFSTFPVVQLEKTWQIGIEGGVHDIAEMKQRDKQRDRHSCGGFFCWVHFYRADTPFCELKGFLAHSYIHSLYVHIELKGFLAHSYIHSDTPFCETCEDNECDIMRIHDNVVRDSWCHTHERVMTHMEMSRDTH